MPTRPLRILACCCVLLLLAGCSATRLAYDHFDTLLRWQASRYVDLEASQRQALDTELQRLQRWHRQTQLPLYAAELRQLAAAVQAGPLSLEQIQACAVRIDGYWNNFVDQALPGYARLHVLLSDAQVAQMIERIGKEIDRRSRKQLKLSEAERRQHLGDEMDDTLRDWIGRPTAQQRQLVGQWAAAVPLVTPQQQQDRRTRLEQYAALLATRAQPGFEERLRAFILPPAAEDRQSPEAQARDRWLQLLADISATLEPDQREHLRARLLGYAEDFEALAAEPQ